MQVDAHLQVEVITAVGEQPGDEADSKVYDQYSEYSSDSSQQYTLRQQLPDNASSACAEAQAHRHLSPACSGSGQQQIGDVGTGDREDEPNHRHQRQERFGKLPAQGIESGSAFLE